MKHITQKVMTMTVNGKEVELLVGEGFGAVSESETLAHTLRDRLGLTGVKIGCNQGACGACTVMMNDRAVTSCMTLTVNCDGADVTTIEGLADRETGELSELQRAFLEQCGYQCGFCTPGIIVTSEALLRQNPCPSEGEVREALAGNYCRCGTHYTAVEAVMAHVHAMNNGGGKAR